MSNPMTNADLQRLASIVRELTGNNVQEKNLSMLESRLRTRMLRVGIEDIQEYWKYYEANEDEERQILQSLMTTHYTFFFREFLHFEALEAWIERHGARLRTRFTQEKIPFRLWSAACSRGHEVYSLAIFLENVLTKKHGVPFEILGTDLDQESVKYAQNGVYPIKEVSTIPQQYLSGYWKKGTGSIKNFAAIHPRIKERVKFAPLNLFDLSALPVKESFDVIFARNVFIYFSEQDVRKVALSLKEHLFEDGLIVTGVSEALRFDGWNLRSVAPSVYESFSAKAAAPQAEVTVKANATTSAKPTYRVLCVDDSGTIQVLLKKIFAQDPSCEQVVSAMNGVEAREKLDQGKFDVITLDIHMPVMGGIEFLEKAYKKHIDPPVLMISSVNRTDVDLATKALSLGAFDYVEKPAMNSLQKSAGEVLTKVKMALRLAGAATKPVQEEDFNKSIGQKIVVRDASQCVRWIEASSELMNLLDPVIRMIGQEYRSPPTVIAAKAAELSSLEAKLVALSTRALARIHDGKMLLKPNHIYLCDHESEAEIVGNLRSKNVSLQLLALPQVDLNLFSGFESVQLLVDESLIEKLQTTIRASRLKLSDVTPSTSFVSLSLEFFANIRKNEAA